MLLNPKDLLEFGLYLDSVARDPAKFRHLQRDSNVVLNDYFKENLTLPVVPRIVVHENTANYMHMVIPWVNDIDKALTLPYNYPDEYFPGRPKHVPESDKVKAIKFRIGDYTLNSCM